MASGTWTNPAHSGFMPDIVDCNTLITGFHCGRCTTTTQNAPTDYGVLLTFMPTNDSVGQIFISTNRAEMYYRKYATVSGWISWQKITATPITQ